MAWHFAFSQVISDGAHGDGGGGGHGPSITIDAQLPKQGCRPHTVCQPVFVN